MIVSPSIIALIVLLGRRIRHCWAFCRHLAEKMVLTECSKSALRNPSANPSRMTACP
jgi:hypothetical protein